ncbi:rhomboid family intramembrane serine protease [Alloprevotella tannerae]|mgnify:FL=1|uniref:rhomboid family intramembrane serine protease n=1 Tax=Alloprevotella tannerae TaxID=76122 RepID=UPI0028E352B0|nr:rhomboid family intramembrane serine protease [Alloprevotella tannerae]
MNPLQQTPPITKNLLIINSIVLLAQYVLQQRGIADLSQLFGLHFILADDFRPWQLVTYMFLHDGLSHLFFNMFALWMFGMVIERTLGFKRFLIYYFVCGIGAGLCQEAWQLGQYYIEGLQNHTIIDTGMVVIPMSAYLNTWTTIGASGACYGVLLAFGVLYPNERIMLLIPPIPLKAKYMVVGYAAIELVAAFATNGNIAHFAHLGGMLFGWLLLIIWRKKSGGRRSNFSGWENYTPKKPSRWQQWREKRKRNSIQPNAHKNKTSTNADHNYNMQKKADEERIDRILDKVKKSGYASLTDEERDELFRNSQQ